MKKLFIILVIFFFSGKSVGQVWTILPAGSAEEKAFRQTSALKKATLVKLDVPALLAILKTAPMEFTEQARRAPAILTIPMPDGKQQNFRIEETSNFAKGMAEKYPEIKAYRGRGIENPNATARFDYNPYYGFSGQILTAEGTVNIEPLNRNEKEAYKIYFLDDLAQSQDLSRFNCLGNDLEISKSLSQANFPCVGEELKNFRLAVACTYMFSVKVTESFSPTKAQVNSVLSSLLSQLNGLFEKEFAISFDLVETNDAVLFVDLPSDPFTECTTTLDFLNKNQIVLTQVIEPQNFDIGHVLDATPSLGGSGQAGAGSVCNPEQKGRGCSVLPVDDGNRPFFVSMTFGHEIAYQFNAQHTFNSIIGSCNVFLGVSTRNAESAFEPGSGTTIMSYAGSCSSDNIQPKKDEYFHSNSFESVRTFLMTAGNSCGNPFPTLTLNHPPQISEMKNNGANIPKQTPFTLTAVATDPDGDPITYCWEEIDQTANGGVWDIGRGDGVSPLFRSRLPKSSGSRTFPDMRVILADFPAAPPEEMDGLKGEVLSNVARPIKFRVTVRDGQGGVVSGGNGCQSGFQDPFQIFVDGISGPFQVVYPGSKDCNSNPLKLKASSCDLIEWDVAKTNESPINCQFVKISLSTDGGQTFPIILHNSTENDGKADFKIPFINSSSCRIKIEAIGNIFFAVGKEFEIELIEVHDLNVIIKKSSQCGPYNTIELDRAGFKEECRKFEYTVDGISQVGNRFFDHLLSGNHTATIQYVGGGCLLSKDFVIPEKPNVTLTVTGSCTRAFCNFEPAPMVTLVASASGGSGNYSYNWPGGVKRTNIVGEHAYVAKVTDVETGCTARQTVFVNIIPVVCPIDPNDITGPAGYGPSKMVSKFSNMPYTIRFENDPKFATAPAQVVKITAPLDAHLNPFSFRLGNFGFGKFNFAVPENRTSYSTRLDVTDSLGVVVDVTAGIDIAKKEAFWIFESKDPATGLPPSDPLLGFLPVNDSLKGNGEGFVNFSVKPAATSQTGDSVFAIAHIIFDVNAPLATQVIFNTIDAVSPVSQLNEIPDVSDTSLVGLSWTAADDVNGSGVSTYDLYASQDGAAFVRAESGLEDTTTTFLGEYGSTYRFFVIATDNTGNSESLKNLGEQTVFIRKTESKPNLGPDQSVGKCKGEPFNLNSLFNLSGLAPEWDIPNPQGQIIPGNFRLIVTNAGGLKDTSNVTLFDFEKPNLGKDTILHVCSGDSINISQLYDTSGYAFKSWSTANPDNAGAGIYRLIVKNQENCADTAQVTILENSSIPTPITSPSGPLFICQGDSVTLLSSGPNGNLWSTGQTSNSITIKANSTITLRTIVQACTSEVSAPVTVQITQTGQVNVQPAGGTFSGSVQVTLSSSTSGANIIYSLDGSVPMPGSPGTQIYNSPIGITSTSVLKTRSSQGACLGIINSANFLIQNISNQVDKPIISPGSGSYSNPQTVSISCTVQDAVIYYTTNGNVPVLGTSFTKIYTGPFQVLATSTIRAIAIKEGLTNSGVAVAYLTISNPGIVATPVFSPGGGTFSGSVLLTIETSTPGAEIWYTTNGNLPRFDVPNSFTKLYTGPISLFSSSTIKAVARKQGLLNSSFVSSNFSITNPLVVSAPEFSPPPGVYPASTMISLSSPTQGASIFYTTNGNTPRFDVPNSFTKPYTGPFQLSASSTVRAVATMFGYLNSPVSVGIYSIGGSRIAVDEFNFDIDNPSDFFIIQNDSPLTVYPNPTTGKFITIFPKYNEEAQIKIFNMLGSLVLELKVESNQDQLPVDISKCSPGLYKVQYQNALEKKSISIFKQ